MGFSNGFLDMMLLWDDLYLPQIRIDALTLVPQNVTIFWDGVFKEPIKAKWSHKGEPWLKGLVSL